MAIGLAQYTAGRKGLPDDQKAAPDPIAPATLKRYLGIALVVLALVVGAALAGFAGALIGAVQSVQVGMGEPVLILAFVVIVIGGIGSIKGAFIGALLVGLTDTMGRALLPTVFATFMDPAAANSVGASLASMAIYILMAGVLIFRPRGLFGAAT